MVSSKYYIVDVTNVTNVRAYSTPFASFEQALIQLEDWYGLDYDNFEIVSYKDIIKYNIPMRKKRRVYTKKYVYPLSRVTEQQRKTWRTIRRKRFNDKGQYIMVRDSTVENGKTVVEWAQDIPEDMNNTFTLRRTPGLMYCLLAKRAEKPGIKCSVWLTAWCMVYNENTFIPSVRSVNLFLDDDIQPIPLDDFYQNLSWGNLENTTHREAYYKVGFNK